MPQYIYKCKKCGQELEIERSIKAKPLTKINHYDSESFELCSGEVEIKITNTNFQLKGAGFYKNDYGKK